MRGYQYLLLVVILVLLAVGLWQFYVATFHDPPASAAEELWLAVGELDAATVQTLLDTSPEFIRGTDEHGRTLLAHAVRQGRDDDDAVLTVGLLIEWDADVAAADHRGQSPLHVAARLGLPNVARTLLAAGASSEAKDATGRTPLDIAEEFHLDQFSDIGKDKRLQDRRGAVADLLRNQQSWNESLRDAE
jgi:hypothetical protein